LHTARRGNGSTTFSSFMKDSVALRETIGWLSVLVLSWPAATM
jgi:fluoride ion exporter CrcB/FEX